MLAKAATESPGIEWQQADLGTWRPERPPTVIYSNAALHWLDDHEELFPAIFASLAPGGVLAVQIPRNFSALSHTSITATALDGPWRATLEPLLRPAPVAAPEFYYDLLAPRAASLDMWETEYLQVLEGDNPVKEWTKGTWLSPLLDALDEPHRSDFEQAYAERVAAAYPQRNDSKTLFPFRRLFMIATAT
jgi:trans-aconitate 2-methyltransferase